MERMSVCDRACRAAGCDRLPSQVENSLNEANVEPLAEFDSAFQTQFGFAVRAERGYSVGGGLDQTSGVKHRYRVGRCNVL
jgi:hypothetical protein